MATAKPKPKRELLTETGVRMSLVLPARLAVLLDEQVRKWSDPVMEANRQNVARKALLIGLQNMDRSWRWKMEKRKASEKNAKELANAR